MKLTLEPTTKEPHNTVVISTLKDDLTVEEAVELVKAALLAWGYHPDIVKECFFEE